MENKLTRLLRATVILNPQENVLLANTIPFLAKRAPPAAIITIFMIGLNETKITSHLLYLNRHHPMFIKAQIVSLRAFLAVILGRNTVVSNLYRFQ